MAENQAENITLETNIDWFLQVLVSLVNKTNIGIGITLNVGGLIVSGELAGGRSYFEGLAQEMTSANADDVIKDAFQGDFKQISSQYEPQAEEAAEENNPPPVFIHLKNAKIYSSTELGIPDSGTWWRSRLSSVNGFFLGQLSI